MGPPLHHLCHRCLMLQAVQRGEAAVDDDSGDDTNGPDEARGHRPQAPLTVRVMDRSEDSGRMPAPSEVAPASTQDDAPYDDRSGTGALVRNQASDVELTTPVEGAGLAVPSTGHPDEPVADDRSELGSETGDLDEDVDMFERELEEDLIFICFLDFLRIPRSIPGSSDVGKRSDAGIDHRHHSQGRRPPQAPHRCMGKR